jgi:hypothetical protein
VGLEANSTVEGLRIATELRAAEQKVSDLEKENALLLKQLTDSANAEKSTTSGPFSGKLPCNCWGSLA